MTKPKTIQLLGLVCIISAAIFSANGVWEIMQPSIMENEPSIILEPLHFRIPMFILWPICLLLAPSVLFPLFISNGWPRYGALAINGLFWLIFGYAVFTEGRERQVGRAA